MMDFGHVAKRSTLNSFVKAAFPIDPNMDYSSVNPKKSERDQPKLNAQGKVEVRTPPPPPSGKYMMVNASKLNENYGFEVLPGNEVADVVIDGDVVYLDFHESANSGEFSLEDWNAFISDGGAVDTIATPNDNVQFLNPDFMKGGTSSSPKKSKGKLSPTEIQEGYERFIEQKTEMLQAMLHAEFNKYATAQTGKVSQAAFLNRDTAPKLINSAQALAMFNVLEREIGLEKRLSALVEKSNRNRSALRKKIMRLKAITGIGALQFWAH
jgi:hypothetical protein